MEGTSVTSIEVANSIPANYIGRPNRGDLSAFLGRVGHIDRRIEAIQAAIGLSARHCDFAGTVEPAGM
jgi:hypothetical protein